jgi:hypothetical protein
MEKLIEPSKIDSTTVYAKCSMANCMNVAEWVIGTWQCCDECAKQHVTETQKGWGYSRWGTSSRAGQAAILAHNIQYNLSHNLIPKNVI